MERGAQHLTYAALLLRNIIVPDDDNPAIHIVTLSLCPCLFFFAFVPNESELCTLGPLQTG